MTGHGEICEGQQGERIHVQLLIRGVLHYPSSRYPSLATVLLKLALNINQSQTIVGYYNSHNVRI